MYFKNLTFFCFPSSIVATLRNLASMAESGLHEHLYECAAKPIGPLELSTRGWVKPMGEDSTGRLFHQAGNCLWLTLGGEDKLLPAAAVNAELAKRLKVIEEREGRKLGGKARKQLKDDLIHALLPKALTRPYRLNGYLDLKRCIAVVDTASRKQAESWVSELRHALGSFPAVPVHAEVAVRAVLTDWLLNGGTSHISLDPQPLPSEAWWLSLSDECVLADPVEGGGIAKFQRQTLRSDEVRKHIETGKQVTRLGLVLDDRLDFVFGEDLAVRKLKLLDVALDKLEAVEREDLAAELDARFALLTGEVGALWDALASAFRFSSCDERPVSVTDVSGGAA